MSQASKIVLAVIVTAIIVGGGVYYWKASKTSQTQNSQSELIDKKTYVFEKYGISLEYDSKWSVRKGYNKEGVIIEAPDQQSGKGTLASFHPDLVDSDIGMGYKTVSEKNYTNPNGITFNVRFMEDDPSFPGAPGEKINPNFVYVVFSLDTLPGAHVFHYYQDMNPNGEQEFWKMVDSFKKG